jgi:hypothetical protein
MRKNNKKDQSPKRTLSINNLIQQVRDELIFTANETKRRGVAPLFIVDKLTIEVNFVVSKGSGSGGGVNLHLVTAEMKNDYKEQQVHKILLELSAIDHSMVLSELNKRLSKSTNSLKKREAISRLEELEDEMIEKIISGERLFTM